MRIRQDARQRDVHVAFGYVRRLVVHVALAVRHGKTEQYGRLQPVIHAQVTGRDVAVHPKVLFGFAVEAVRRPHSVHAAAPACAAGSTAGSASAGSALLAAGGGSAGSAGRLNGISNSLCDSTSAPDTRRNLHRHPERADFHCLGRRGMGTVEAELAQPGSVASQTRQRTAAEREGTGWAMPRGGEGDSPRIVSGTGSNPLPMGGGNERVDGGPPRPGPDRAARTRQRVPGARRRYRCIWLTQIPRQRAPCRAAHVPELAIPAPPPSGEQTSTPNARATP